MVLKLIEGPRRRWLAAAAVMLLAWMAGFLGARLAWNTVSPPPDLDGLDEVAGLPVPRVAFDGYPQHRALLEELAQVAGRMVRSFPTDASAVAALAMVHNLAHDDAGEVACWRRCLELDPAFLPAYSNLSTRAANKGEYQEAEVLLREAMRLPGASPSFSELLATVLMSEGKSQEAAQTLENAMADRPPAARTLVQLGEVYLQLKEYQKAKTQFERAIQIDRSSSRAYHGLARACDRLKATQEAEKCRAEFARLKKAEDQAARTGIDKIADQRVVPDRAAQILTTAANVYSSQLQFDTAERYLKQAAGLSPDDVTCRAALAELYGTQGRLEEALAAVEELRRIEPRNLVHARSLGILQGRLGRWESAETTFRDLCALAPARAVGYAGLAESFLRTGKQLPLARTLAAKAAGLDPSAWNHFILAAICEQQGDRSAARKALEKAIFLDPGNSQYRQLYATIEGKN